MTTDADPHANDAAQREWVARDTDHDESRRVHGVDRTRGSSGMTRPLVLGIAGLAGLGLVLALRARASRERATADLSPHGDNGLMSPNGYTAPPEGDDGLPPVDAGLWPTPTPGESGALCLWRGTEAGRLWCVTHSSYHDGRQA